MTSDRRTALLAQASSLHRAGRLDAAAQAYARILHEWPDETGALTPFAAIALARGEAEQALALVERALAAAPDEVIALSVQGAALQRLGRLDAARESFERVLAQQPGHAESWNNRGVVLRQDGRLDEALASYDRALSLRPDYAAAHNNRGNVLQDLRRLDAANESFDRAIALRPQYAEAWWNKARLRILQGDYEEGWRLAEWRWRGPQRHYLRDFGRPLWLGDAPVAGRTVLVHAEQGQGDCIQFCRYAPMVAALGARVVLEVSAALVALIGTLDDRIAVIEQGRPLPPFDLHCPVMSLPHAFRTTVDTIPGEVPYLRADPARRAAWQRRLGPRTRRRVGLAWSGSPDQAEDRRRSLPVRMLEPLFELPFEFHALQRDVRPGDADFLAGCAAVTRHDAELSDFAETAALAEEMDLVVSVCTSVAHLAGALARPTWILLSFMPDYRWMLDRPDSPWYPTATLLRQRSFNDWAPVVAEARERLRSLAGPEGAG